VNTVTDSDGVCACGLANTKMPVLAGDVTEVVQSRLEPTVSPDGEDVELQTGSPAAGRPRPRPSPPASGPPRAGRSEEACESNMPA
jgi:hypothetical protein